MPPWPVGASLLNQNFVTFDEPTKTGAANLTVSGVGCAVLAASSAAAAAAHGRSGIQRIVGGSDRANINFVGRWASVAPLLRVSIPLHVAMYQAMTPKRGFFCTLIPAPNPNLPMAFGYRQNIPNPYSLRFHPRKVNLSFCKFCRHYQIKPPIMYSNILLLGIRRCFPHL